MDAYVPRKLRSEIARLKNAALMAQWKLTPSPKWLVVRPPRASRGLFLKGGLGICVGVIMCMCMFYKVFIIYSKFIFLH